jgi:hypothetical protein
MVNQQASECEENIQVVHHLVQNAPWLAEWPACRQVFCDSLAKKPSWFFTLPMISCRAVGGTDRDAIPVVAAWGAVDYGAHLMDTVSDGDFTPDETIPTAGHAINFASGLFFSALNFISAIPDPETARRVTQVFSDAGFNATLGQHLSFDSLNDIPIEQALEHYWSIMIHKSGGIFRMGAAGGAAAGTADETLIEALGDYGNALGVIMQLLDDCRDLLDPKTGRFEVSLPILLYSLASGSEKVVFPATGCSEETLLSLQRAHVPEMIAALFQEWQKNALECLEPLNGSMMMGALVKMIPDASNLPF